MGETRARSSWDVVRVGVVIAAAAVGLMPIVLLWQLLTKPQTRLGLFDGLGALGLFVAAAGHVTLLVIVLSPRAVWPLRRGELAQTLFFLAVVSIFMGVAGAAGRFVPHQGPERSDPIMVRGVPTHNVFEFGLMACLFAFPGGALLVLRFLSFAPQTRSVSTRLSAGVDRDSFDSPRDSPFAIVCVGNWLPEKITTVFSPAIRRTYSLVERLIEETWQAQKKLAISDGRMLYNGELGRFVSSAATADRLTLDLGETTYREFVGTNVHNRRMVEEIAGLDALASPLGISAVIVTVDGYLGLGRRSRTVAYHQGFLHTFGGMLEGQDKRPGAGFDVVGALRRELAEELGLTDGDVADSAAIAIVRDTAWHQPELLFEVTVRLDRFELSRRIRTALSAGEHTDIEFCFEEPESVSQLLVRAKPVAPWAQAALLLHGRAQWGADWFEQVCLTHYGEIVPIPASTTRANPVNTTG